MSKELCQPQIKLSEKVFELEMKSPFKSKKVLKIIHLPTTVGNAQNMSRFMNALGAKSDSWARCKYSIGLGSDSDRFIYK